MFAKHIKAWHDISEQYIMQHLTFLFFYSNCSKSSDTHTLVDTISKFKLVWNQFIDVLSLGLHQFKHVRNWFFPQSLKTNFKSSFKTYLKNSSDPIQTQF